MTVLRIFAGSAACLAAYGLWNDWHARRWRQRSERLLTPPAPKPDVEREAFEAERAAVLGRELAEHACSADLYRAAEDLREAAQAARLRALEVLWSPPAVEPRRPVR